MNETKTYSRNVKIDYLYTFVSNFSTVNGFWLIYLAAQGLSLAWIGILEGVFHVTSMLMETPTGAVADIFGRKTSRIAGAVLNVISSAMILMGSEIWHYVVAFVITALSYNLESGAGEALVYDSLKWDGKEDTFVRVGGYKEMVYQSAAAGGLFLGGFLAVRNYNLPYIAAIIIGITAIAVATLFEEVPVENPVKDFHLLKAIGHQYKVSFNFIKERRRLLYLALVLNLVSTFVLIAFYYAQNYWVDGGITESHIGIILGLHSLLAALGGLSAERVEKWLGEKRLIIAGFIFITGTYWAMYWLSASILALILIGFVDSLIYVALSAYMNHMIPSEQRATLLSFSSMMFSILMIAIFPMVGYMGDVFGLNVTFLILAAVLTLVTGLVINWMRSV